MYYFQEDYFIGETLGLGAQFCGLVPVASRPACAASGNKPTATVLDFNQDAENLAAYGQANVGITDTIDVVLGARWTKDEKSASFAQAVNNPFGALLRAPEAVDLINDDDQFTYRVGLNWTPSNDLLVFGSYSTGYKSGGFNSGGGNVSARPEAPVRQGNRRTTMRLAPSGRWPTEPHTSTAPCSAWTSAISRTARSTAPSFNVINAGDLRNQGVELDAGWTPIELDVAVCVCRLPRLGVRHLSERVLLAVPGAGKPGLHAGPERRNARVCP